MQISCSIWQVCLRVMMALAFVATCDLSCLRAEQPAKKALPEPLPKEVLDAWKKAGADVGWMRIDTFGSLKLMPEKERAAGDLPAFGFTDWKNGQVVKLPSPAAAFGLHLFGSKVRDVGLKDLAALKNLQALNLRFNQVSDAGLKELTALKNLRILNLGFTYVSDAGLKELAALENLEALELFRTQVTAVGLKELAGLKKLQTLDLGGTQVTDTGLKELSGLKSLQALNLNGTRVTDMGLRELAGLKELRVVDLRGTAVTNAGAKELQKALPDCKISLKVQSLELETPPPP
jgi:internalin A